MKEENSLLWQATMEELYNRIEELEDENRKLKDEKWLHCTNYSE